MDMKQYHFIKFCRPGRRRSFLKRIVVIVGFDVFRTLRPVRRLDAAVDTLRARTRESCNYAYDLNLNHRYLYELNTWWEEIFSS